MRPRSWPMLGFTRRQLTASLFLTGVAHLTQFSGNKSMMKASMESRAKPMIWYFVKWATTCYYGALPSSATTNWCCFAAFQSCYETADARCRPSFVSTAQSLLQSSFFNCAFPDHLYLIMFLINKKNFSFDSSKNSHNCDATFCINTVSRLIESVVRRVCAGKCLSYLAWIFPGIILRV